VTPQLTHPNSPGAWSGLYCASKAAVHTLSDVLAMECKPFGVKVMLVAPGAVKSNISANQAANFQLSPTSIYKAYSDRMYEMMHMSQEKGSMPADEFARRVVAKALSPNPPGYMSLGGQSHLAAFLQWLPRQLLIWVVGSQLVWRKG
jgi:short-subunit dehydrogenase